MLKQPISVLEGEKGDDMEDIALKLFYTIQQHAGMKRHRPITLNKLYPVSGVCVGITPSSGSGFVEVESDDCVTMVQLTTQKCLEREALCNEFYLQLIKQTTDQPGK